MLKHLLILGGIFGGFWFLARGTAWQGPYVYDEADYQYAVSFGWRANWIDSPSLPFPEFLRLGLSSRASTARANLSELIRNRDDVLFYRHWHGPIYSDWLRLVRGFGLDERTTRAAGVVFPALAAMLLYFGSLWLLPGSAGQTAAILASVLYLWSVPVVRSTELAPHQLFVSLVVAALLLLSKMIQQERAARTYWYSAIAATAVAFCVLEVAFALLIAVLTCGYIKRASLKPDLAFAGKSIGAFAIPVALLWPAAILKLSLIKAFLFMGYLAAFRKASWGSDISIGQTWWLRFISSPVLWILFLAAGALFFINRRKWSILIPFLLFSTIMGLAILPVNTDVLRYSLPLLPGVALFAACGAGLLLAQTSASLRITALISICAVMFVTSWPKARSGMPSPNASADSMLALMRDHDLSHKTLLVPQEDLPMLHYYFPSSRYKGYSNEAAASGELHSGGANAVIYRNPVRIVLSCVSGETAGIQNPLGAPGCR